VFFGGNEELEDSIDIRKITNNATDGFGGDADEGRSGRNMVEFCLVWVFENIDNLEGVGMVEGFFEEFVEFLENALRVAAVTRDEEAEDVTLMG